MIERFSFHHPNAYRRLLGALMAAVLLAGMQSAGADRPKPLIHPGMTPPVAKYSPEKKEAKAPEGWEGVNRLPGSDGTGKEKPVSSQATVAAIPLAGGDALSIGKELTALHFGDAHWPALQALWNRESGWNPAARNRYSGACGIPQALPCSKIPDMSTQGQIEWGLNYIKGRYGNPTNAWRFWLSHGWY